MIHIAPDHRRNIAGVGRHGREPKRVQKPLRPNPLGDQIAQLRPCKACRDRKPNGAQRRPKARPASHHRANANSPLNAHDKVLACRRIVGIERLNSSVFKSLKLNEWNSHYNLSTVICTIAHTRNLLSIDLNKI
jgi:hypothetical protein